MKKILLVIICLFLLSCQEQENDKKVKVLFIGNSLTYFHDMPQMLQKLLDESEENFKIEQSTFPGYSLINHLEMMPDPNQENSSMQKKIGDTTATEKKLLQKPWDIVILQEGTVKLLIPEAKDSLVIPSIKKIKKLVTNKDCRFIIFQTWTSQEEFPKEYCYGSLQITKKMGDEQYCSEKILTKDREIKLIDSMYHTVANTTQIEKSNNGNIAYQFTLTHPEIELYDDEIHPSEEGAFLNACVFYELLTKKKAAKLKYQGTLDEGTATTIKDNV